MDKFKSNDPELDSMLIKKNFKKEAESKLRMKKLLLLTEMLVQDL
jgi:hypothetical protein